MITGVTFRSVYNPFMKKIRNIVPANEARTKKADDHAMQVFIALRPLIEANASLAIMRNYLNNYTDLEPPRNGHTWRRTQVSRIIKRVRDRNLCP